MSVFHNRPKDRSFFPWLGLPWHLIDAAFFLAASIKWFFCGAADDAGTTDDAEKIDVVQLPQTN